MTTTSKAIGWFRIILGFIGIACMFFGIWAEGWDIVRWLATGIILLIWNYGIGLTQRDKK